MTLLHRAEDLTSRGAGYMGLTRTLRALHERHLVVLNYHGVVPDQYAQQRGLYSNVVGVSEFTRQMNLVAQLFHPIRASELRNWQVGMYRSAVLVTFDDGYRNVLNHAAPVLQELGIPALLAICPGYIGQKRLLWPTAIQRVVLWWPEKDFPMPFPQQKQRLPETFTERLALANCVRESCKRLRSEDLAEYRARLCKHPVPEPMEEVDAFLSWEDVVALTKYGFEIGSHTMEHPILAQLGAKELVRELRESKSIIEERIRCECTCFAYPNGSAADFTPSVVEEVRRAGYKFAFTVMGRLAAPNDDPLLLDRIYVPEALSTADFEGRISGLHSKVKCFLTRWTVRL